MERTVTGSDVDGPQHRLVVGVDGSEGGARALDWAASQAARTGSLLEIHTADSNQYDFVTQSEVQQAMVSLTEEAVARAEKLASGVTTKAVTHEGAPAKVLVEASPGADLLVVGSRGLGGFGGMVLGSVGRSCGLHAHCPVVIVRPSRSAPDERQWWPPKRIVVGVDGSDSSTEALEWALGEAELTEAVVVAITSWTWPNSFGWGVPLPADISMAKDADTILHDVLDPAQERHPSVTISTEVVNGHPAPTLVDASRTADLLVVGSRGHGELVGALLGSVAEHCVSHAGCPVLIMRRT